MAARIKSVYKEVWGAPEGRIWDETILYDSNSQLFFIIMVGFAVVFTIRDRMKEELYDSEMSVQKDELVNRFMHSIDN